ncbi:thymidylate synthase [Nocardiopsis alba]|uniref:thymidylate synthase n=1 Tax=Nocardiopsis alba TaxID=53437 RepID=UPI0033B1B7CF
MNRNITDALLHVLANIEDEGDIVVARGQEQREVLSSLTKIERPQERFLVLPGRNNNVFAQIAETAWVLAGRDDLEFLSHYLPRAADFSDDGKTWRAAYGPRIRRWGGEVDQVAQVVERLREDPYTKRAVISIFDPGSDFGETKDVPCNNWLQFIQRGGRLDLHVTVRANDAIWGFSGINFFEWSVLHEIVARSLGWEVGALSWFVGTFHVYSRHYTLAGRLRSLEGIRSPYEEGVSTTGISTTVERLDGVLVRLFEAEEHARAGRFDDAERVEREISDPFFRYSATMLRLYNAYLMGRDRTDVLDILHELHETDFFTAAAEYIARRWKDDSAIPVPPGPQSAFFEQFRLVRDRRLLPA